MIPLFPFVGRGAAAPFYLHSTVWAYGMQNVAFPWSVRQISGQVGATALPRVSGRLYAAADLQTLAVLTLWGWCSVTVRAFFFHAKVRQRHPTRNGLPLHDIFQKLCFKLFSVP